MRIDPEKLKANIENLYARDLSTATLFGCACFVAQDGKTLYRGFHGRTSPDGGPVTDKTLFRLASMTKPVLTVAALILVDRGLLSLSDPVKKYLPVFENTRLKGMDGSDLGPVKTDVTVLNLLTHTSGIGDIDPVRPFEKDTLDTIESYVNFIGGKVYFEPFSMQSYSGTANFDVLAAVIQKITGETLESFIRREIFDPLGMTDATFVPSPDQWSRLIKMHTREDGKNAVSPTPDGCLYENFPATHMAGGAGLAATLDDYARFAAMLVNYGAYDGGRILKEATVKDMATPHYDAPILSDSGDRWGLGVRVVTDDRGPLAAGSFGWCGAYGTNFWVDPENRVAAVFMKNSRVDGGFGCDSNVRFERAVSDAFIK